MIIILTIIISGLLTYLFLKSEDYKIISFKQNLISDLKFKALSVIISFIVFNILTSIVFISFYFLYNFLLNF